jgi:hypothetical protein
MMATKPGATQQQEQQTIVTVTAQPHSVQLGRNASGVKTIEVKVYGDTPDLAYAEAKRIFNQADREFPYQKL